MQTVNHNAYAQDPYAQEFGIKISEKLASVEARILPAPWVIDYHYTISVNRFVDVIYNYINACSMILIGV